MAIADIIHEIDAYLARLRQARDLLATFLPGELHARESSRRKKAPVGKTAPALPGKRRVTDVKSRLNSAERKVKPARGLNTSTSEQLGPVAPQTVEVYQPLIAPAAPVPIEIPAPAQDPEKAEFGTPRRRPRRRVVRENSRAIAETRKPANALSNPVTPRIIVVSAAEVQRQRERAAQSVAVRPRVSWTGQTGRLAFESLFKNEPDTSQANGGTRAVDGMNDKL